MHTVGIFEAKTHLSNLLEQVENGEQIVITRHGRAIAKITITGKIWTYTQTQQKKS